MTMSTPVHPVATPLLQRVGIMQEKVYKTCIADLDELKERLRTDWARLDHVIIATDIRQWRRRLSTSIKAGEVVVNILSTVFDFRH